MAEEGEGEVAGADQRGAQAVADPNREAPQPHAGLRAVCLHPLGDRRPRAPGPAEWIKKRKLRDVSTCIGEHCSGFCRETRISSLMAGYKTRGRGACAPADWRPGSGPIRRRSQSVANDQRRRRQPNGRRPPPRTRPPLVLFADLSRLRRAPRIAQARSGTMRASHRLRSQRAYAALAFWRSRPDSTSA
jgi:hypothetical protein